MSFFLHGGKRLYVAFGLCHDIGKRTEESQFKAAVAHGLNHGGIVGRHDQVDFFVQGFFKIGLQGLVVLDDGTGAFVGQQGHLQHFGVGVGGHGCAVGNKGAKQKKGDKQTMHGGILAKERVDVDIKT